MSKIQEYLFKTFGAPMVITHMLISGSKGRALFWGREKKNRVVALEGTSPVKELRPEYCPLHLRIFLKITLKLRKSLQIDKYDFNSLVNCEMKPMLLPVSSLKTFTHSINVFLLQNLKYKNYISGQLTAQLSYYFVFSYLQ